MLDGQSMSSSLVLPGLGRARVRPFVTALDCRRLWRQRIAHFQRRCRTVCYSESLFGQLVHPVNAIIHDHGARFLC